MRAPKSRKAAANYGISHRTTAALTYKHNPVCLYVRGRVCAKTDAAVASMVRNNNEPSGGTATVTSNGRTHW